MINKLIVIFFLLCFQTTIFARQASTSFITNYPPDVYKAASQNWAIVQDKRGVIYFGNNVGVLEYDGVSWRLIKTPNIVRSLAIDSTGRIYVGLNADFGYLHTDSLGNYQYRSLKEKIPSQHFEFNDLWEIHVSGKQVFFLSAEKIFILHNEKFKVVYPKESFHLSFLFNHSYYVIESEQGLMTYKNDSLQLIEGGDRFDKDIYAILPYSQNKILLATRTQGVWISSPQENNKLHKPAGFKAVDKFLNQHSISCGTVLNHGLFALGTLSGGIIVFNSKGSIQTIYNTGSGLLNDVIGGLYYDNNKQLWAALDNGISLVQSNLPFQRFSTNNGLVGDPYSIDYFNNLLYVCTSQYLCLQNPDGNFETIPGTEGQNWQLLEVNGKLLLANVNGLMEIKEKQAIPLIKDISFLNLCRLKNKPDFLLAGLYEGGVCLLEYDQNTWKIKNPIKGFSKDAYLIVQDKEGYIWVTTYSVLHKLDLNETMDSVISVMECAIKHGLPTNSFDPYLLNSGEVVFFGEKGVYRYRSATNTFEQHPDFKMLNGSISAFRQSKNGDIWFEEEKAAGIYEKGVLKYINGNYQLFKQAFYKFNDYLMEGSYNFYVAPDSTVFMGTIKSLIQYNPIQKVDYNIPFHTIIRKVFSKDTLLFGGTTENANEFESIKGTLIPYKKNDLVFHYAASFYEDVEKNKYSYRLIGSDTTWSAWVSDVKKEYTNLREGKYTFEVKSKNQYKVIGSIATYSFRILPPWHRTWWAYALYVLALILLIFFILKLALRRVVKAKIRIEGIVLERTSEIMLQKEEIQSQAEELKVANNTKDKFFSIIAHDLKSPFSTLIGFSNLLLEKHRKYDDEKKEKMIKYINNIAISAFKLLENLLTWARIQSGRISYSPEKMLLGILLVEILYEFQAQADKKEIQVLNKISDTEIIFADKNMIATVFRNLISNAIKFTRKNGTIEIGSEKQQNGNFFEISINDSGVGIPKNKIYDIFRIDKNTSTLGTDNETGTGIGLSLCKEFVEKHGGKIWVDSEEGKGSKFKFTVPLKDLRENDLVK